MFLCVKNNYVRKLKCYLTSIIELKQISRLGFVSNMAKKNHNSISIRIDYACMPFAYDTYFLVAVKMKATSGSPPRLLT